MYGLLEGMLTILKGLVSKLKRQESLVLGSVLIAALFALVVLTFLFVLAVIALLSV